MAERESRNNIVSENGHWEYKANIHNVNETKAELKGKIELIQKYISNKNLEKYYKSYLRGGGKVGLMIFWPHHTRDTLY